MIFSYALLGKYPDINVTVVMVAYLVYQFLYSNTYRDILKMLSAA